MKIVKTRTYEITYSVECFEETEGGMTNAVFVHDLDTIKEALEYLDLALARDKDTPWIITCSVIKKIT